MPLKGLVDGTGFPRPTPRNDQEPSILGLERLPNPVLTLRPEGRLGHEDEGGGRHRPVAQPAAQQPPHANGAPGAPPGGGPDGNNPGPPGPPPPPPRQGEGMGTTMGVGPVTGQGQQ